VDKSRFFNSFIFLAGVSLSAFFMSSCDNRVHTRGNFLDPEKLVDIQPGKISRNEVREILGSPSSVMPFKRNNGSNAWYYISQRTETLAFFEPQVMNRQVIVISFDEGGKVTSVDTLGLEQGKKIIPVSRKTLTHGNEMTILDQLVGNINRFKSKNKKAQDEDE
jgi:outer membrane protein assembly factor BamE (lipoprotein component of BamABCDE complex)|tara:strand:+ start:83 stop:574 length:492 start_codon:yes stop_codon:yes gene_type:complete